MKLPKTDHPTRVLTTEDNTTSDTLAGKRYCSSAIKFPVGDRLEIVCSVLDDTVRILPSHTARLLDKCQSFKTLSEHAEECYRQLKLYQDQKEAEIQEMADHVLSSFFSALLKRAHSRKKIRDAEIKQVGIESIKRQLLDLNSHGFLVSDDFLIDAPPRSVVPLRTPGKIASIGVVTCDRLESLKHCISSYIENSRSHSRSNDFVVVDDTGDASRRDATKQMLMSLRTNYGAEIYYAGLEEKVHFAKTLTDEAGLPSDVVNFAFFDTEDCGYSAGANRNALLIHTVGDMVVSVDDDTVCQLSASPNIRDRLAFFSGLDPTEFWFFPDREMTLRSASFVDKDFLATHEELLGKSFGARLSEVNGFTELIFNGANPNFIRDLKTGRGEILITFNGLVGDSGLVEHEAYLYLDGRSRERLTRSEADYTSAQTSREVLRVANQPSVSASAWCMTTALGYDNRTLLPPFMPVGRNQDGLFSFVLQKCFQNSYTAHLPWAILHTPVQKRLYARDHFKYSGTKTRINDFIMACVLTFNSLPGVTDKKEKLRALGTYLMDVGSLEKPDFEHFMRLQLWRNMSNYASLLENQLRIHKKSPDYWVKDVEDSLSSVREAILKKEFIVPHDLIDKHGFEGARNLAPRLIFKFGQLLYYWPDMIEATKSFRLRNKRLGICL